MSQKAYLGIDLAKGNSKVVVVDENGDEIAGPFSISNCKEGVEKLMSKLHKYKKRILSAQWKYLPITGRTFTHT